MASHKDNALVKPRLDAPLAERRRLLRLRKTLSRIEEFFYRLDKRLLLVLLLAVEAAIFWVDLKTDPTLIVAPYYLVPIMISAWLLDRRLTYALLSLAVMARVYAYRDLFPESTPFLYWHNFILSAAAYSCVEILIYRVKQLVTRLALHADHLQRHGRNVNRRHRLEATIRRAVPADADEIVRLTVLGAQDGAFSANALTSERQQELSLLIRQTVAAARGVRDLWDGGKAAVPMDYWLSVVNGSVAGYIMVIGVDDKLDADRELHAVVVAESHRGLGVGSAMTDFFCTHFRKRRLTVACKPGTRMMAMMERRGFRRYASAQGYELLEKLG